MTIEIQPYNQSELIHYSGYTGQLTVDSLRVGWLFSTRLISDFLWIIEIRIVLQTVNRSKLDSILQKIAASDYRSDAFLRFYGQLDSFSIKQGLLIQKFWNTI